MKKDIASFFQTDAGLMLVVGVVVALMLLPVIISAHLEMTAKAYNEYRLELARIQNGARLEQVRVGVSAGATPPPN